MDIWVLSIILATDASLFLGFLWLRVFYYKWIFLSPSRVDLTVELTYKFQQVFVLIHLLMGNKANKGDINRITII